MILTGIFEIISYSSGVKSRVLFPRKECIISLINSLEVPKAGNGKYIDLNSMRYLNAGST